MYKLQPVCGKRSQNWVKGQEMLRDHLLLSHSAAGRRCPETDIGFIGLNPAQCAVGISEQPEAKLNVTIEIRTSVIQEEAGNLGV